MVQQHHEINPDADLDADDEKESEPIDVTDFLDPEDLEPETIPMDLSEAIHEDDLERFRKMEDELDEEEYDDTYNEISFCNGFVVWTVWKDEDEEGPEQSGDPVTTAKFRASEKAPEYEKQQHERSQRFEQGL